MLDEFRDVIGIRIDVLDRENHPCVWRRSPILLLIGRYEFRKVKNVGSAVADDLRIFIISDEIDKVIADIVKIIRDNGFYVQYSTIC